MRTTAGQVEAFNDVGHADQEPLTAVDNDSIKGQSHPLDKQHPVDCVHED